MLTDIYYIFNKKDYFNYFFLTIFIYIFLQRTLVFNLQSLVPIIVTVAIIYFLIKNKTAKEFSDFITDKLTHKTEIIPIKKVRPQDHIWMNILPNKHKDIGQYTYASFYDEPTEIFTGLKSFEKAAIFVTSPKPEKEEWKKQK